MHKTCLAQPMLSIYMIVMGAVALCFLCTLLVTLTSKSCVFGQEEEAECERILCCCCFSIVIGCFLVGWLIFGSVIVFGMKTDEDQSQLDNCQFAYVSAYIVTVI